jgi:hypothetical protein
LAVSFKSRENMYTVVIGQHPNQVYLGKYRDEKKARNVENEFNNGMSKETINSLFPSDKKVDRRSKTGIRNITIKRRKSGTESYQVIVKGIHVGLYSTLDIAVEALKRYKETGEFMVENKRKDYYVHFNSGNDRYQLLDKNRKSRGYYETEEEAEKVGEKFKYGIFPTIKRGRPRKQKQGVN